MPRHRMMGRIALALFLEAACAGRGTGGQRAALLSELPADRPGACEVALTPPQLPAVDALVDSARLTDAIRDMWAARRFATGYLLLTLAYDGRGRNSRLAMLERNVTAAAADSGRGLVQRSLRPLERDRDVWPVDSAPPPGWGVRLRLDVRRDRVELRVGRQEYCPPRPRDTNLEQALAGVQAGGVRYREGRRERTIFMSVWVHPSGYVSRASVSRGLPLTTTFEQRLVDYVKQFSFFPALLDGDPVEGWIEIPIRVQG